MQDEIKPSVSIEIPTKMERESTPIQIISCKIDYTGQANVSSFFPQQLEADGWTSFRGTSLQPFKHKTPSGFQLNVAKKKDDEENAYIVEEVQRELTLWERDEHTPYSTNLPKMLNYLKVAQAFAADDDD